MGARRRWIRNTLAALTALALLGVLGVGVWAASTDEDEPVQAALGSPSDEDDEEDGQPAEEPSLADDGAPAEENSPGAGDPPPSATEDPAGEPTLGETEPGGGETAPGATAPGDTQPGETSQGDSEPGEAAPGEPRKTRFPRERREDPSRRGREFVVPPAREFTGTGNALIGTVVVSEPVVVRWRSRGRFGLEFGRESFPIVAPSRSGQLAVPPFRFDFVRVVASGRWTITVTPQG
jgi:hypothetical protein